MREVWRGTEVHETLRRRDGGIGGDDEPVGVVGSDGGGAVAQPEQVPVVAVRGVRVCGGGGDVLGTAGEEGELRF